MSDLQNCNDFTDLGIEIERSEVLQAVKKIYSKKCDENLSTLKHIKLFTIDEVENLNINLNTDTGLDITNIVFVSILNIILIILIIKLYSKII